MNLIKITDLVSKLGISSRSLRYYEQIGLIRSIRPEYEKYRYYDEENLERLRQIMVLRKMEIPVKDILRIYESADMSVVVEAFVGRIRAIDEEMDALTELRAVVDDFLQVMLQSGITRISVLPILYEQMEKRLNTIERSKQMKYKELSALSDKLVGPINPAIIELPPMRVLSSGQDAEGFLRYVQSTGIPMGRPGLHEQFEMENEILLRVAEDFASDSVYSDAPFNGGLYAAANVYLDEDVGQRFRALVSCFDDNKFYEVDYTRASMLENLLSPDEKRELVSLLVPVKKRLPDPALYDAPREVTEISIQEIEAANPVLWEVNVPLDSLIPINHPYYHVNELGEAEYKGYISTRVLSTNVKVKLPFRVDMEFRFDESSAQYGYGGDEGSIVFHHGGDLNYLFGINMENRPDETLSREALQFHQPLFRDLYNFPGKGSINKNVYNTLTWIVGQKHLAVFVNGELRYCGEGFPYMQTDLSRSDALPIILGSNGQGMKYYKSIRISQLAYTPKPKIKEGEMSMVTKQSNNIIPNIHRFITSEHGENYWFNGCGRYVMGALGEKNYDYEFFAGLTGDVFAQIYPYGRFLGDGVTDYVTSVGNSAFIEDVFRKCGYAATFVPDTQLVANKGMYVQTLTAYIDKGVPVISNLVLKDHPQWAVFVGYEEHGKTLLFMTDNMTEPERISSDEVFRVCRDDGDRVDEWVGGLLFVGEKTEHKDLKQLYRDIIYGLPALLTTKTEHYCFGAEAFRTWANDIDNGKFDGMKPEEFDGWCMYSSYVCNAATNGSCCHEFLRRARELNPDMDYLEEVSRLYRRTAEMWGGDNIRNDPDSLEALGGGFNITLEALQDKGKRGRIAAKLREFAACMDEIVRVLEQENKDDPMKGNKNA